MVSARNGWGGIFRSILLFCAIICYSFLERIDIEIPLEYSLGVVVDGFISDQPGPYKVELRRLTQIDGPQVIGLPYAAKKVEIFDDTGFSEELQQKDDGIYETKTIQGKVGRSYALRIEAHNGSVFESTLEILKPVGEIERVYYEFETFQPDDRPTEYGYRVFIDSRSIPGDENYVRWKFIGTYIVETLPQYHISENPPCSYDPLPCSGYAYYNGELRQGYAYNPKTKEVEYVPGLKCTCCRCYVPQYEDKPRVSGNQLVQNGRFVKVEVGFVPVTFYTFFERYRVEVQQMSLSKSRFDFWKSIQAQKEAVNSIFQPVSGLIPSNFKTISGTGEVKGIFYASAITKKQIYIDKSTNRVDIRTPVDCLGRVGPSGESCLIKFPDATTIKPPDWID
jgi:hypothetical protein